MSERPESPEAAQTVLADVVRAAITPVMQQAITDNMRGEMAALRRAAAVPMSDDPVAWAQVSELLTGHIPQSWLGDEEPTSQEWAAYTAITHWGLHQQSQPTPMHINPTDSRTTGNFGQAIGTLSHHVVSDGPKRRFDALLAGLGRTGVQHHLRSLIQQLRTHEIRVDYGRLASDLHLLQSPRGRSRVAMNWGRGFSHSRQQSFKNQG